MKSTCSLPLKWLDIPPESDVPFTSLSPADSSSSSEFLNHDPVVSKQNFNSKTFRVLLDSLTVLISLPSSRSQWPVSPGDVPAESMHAILHLQDASLHLNNSLFASQQVSF